MAKADTLTTKQGRVIEVKRSELRKMRTLAALTSANIDRILGAVGKVVTNLTEDEIGDLTDEEFSDLIEAVSAEYRVPKAS